MNKTRIISILCILIIMLSGCKSNPGGSEIKSTFSDIDRTQLTAVNFVYRGPAFDETYEGEKAVNETLDYLESIPILYKSVTAEQDDDGDFVIGGPTNKIVFLNSTGEAMLVVDGLYYGHESEVYGTSIGNIFVYGKLIPDGETIQYVVPSSYIETIVDYIRQNAEG